MTMEISKAIIVLQIIASLLKVIGTCMLANALSPMPFWEWPRIIAAIFKTHVAHKIAAVWTTFGQQQRALSVRGLGIIIVGFVVEFISTLLKLGQ